MISYFYHGEVLFYLPRIERIERISVLWLLEAKQKPEKPLGEDGGRCPRLLFGSALQAPER